jgi:alkyldihydroxyacetonephosphate synthase
VAELIVDTLRGTLGSDVVSVDPVTRRSHRRDYWLLSQLEDVDGAVVALPACVVRPRNVDDVVAVVNACRSSGAALVPYGLGSGVCGAIVAPEGSVVLDMSSMARVREVDTNNLVASFDAGVRGTDAEEAVGKAGLTLGHYPQSIGVSSVGGWIATRAAGQYSTGYGNIEDIVLDLEAVLPDGSVLSTRRTPRASTGPDLRHILMGSEGTLGVVTGVGLSVRRIAEHRAVEAYYAPSMEAGLDLQREIVQTGLLPVVMRQYDTVETQRMFSGQARNDDGLILLVFEGPKAMVEAGVNGARALAKSAGCDSAPAAAGEHWLAERNHVPSFEQFLRNGVVVDTIEVAATWDRIKVMYRDAVESLSTVPGILTGSAHSSHAYRSGINLYFTFAARPPERDRMRWTYEECWRRVMEATIRVGGTIAHHHGIGRVRRAWLEKELGPAGLVAMRALKRALDPSGFMNPGALLPD